MSLKRYLLFVGSNYYPSGGMDDFEGDFDSLREAQKYFRSIKVEKGYKSGWSWYHIYDQEIKKKASSTSGNL